MNNIQNIVILSNDLILSSKIKYFLQDLESINVIIIDSLHELFNFDLLQLNFYIIDINIAFVKVDAKCVHRSLKSINPKAKLFLLDEYEDANSSLIFKTFENIPIFNYSEPSIESLTKEINYRIYKNEVDNL